MASAQYSRWIGTTLREAGWAPSLVFVVHVIVDVAFDAYERYPPLDMPAHFLGGVVIAYFFHRASINASRFGVLGPFHPTTHLALVTSLVCSATVFWEFAEYVYDRMFATNDQLGLDDTSLDMLLGILGGAAFLGGAAWYGGALKPARGAGEATGGWGRALDASTSDSP